MTLRFFGRWVCVHGILTLTGQTSFAIAVYSDFTASSPMVRHAGEMYCNRGASMGRQQKVLVFTALPDDLVRFRFHILKTIREYGHELVACAAIEDRLAGVLAIDIPTFLAEYGITYRPFPLRRTGLNPLSDLRTCWALYRLCRVERPDVVLCCNAKPIVYGTLAAKAAGVRAICTLVTGLGFGAARHSRNSGLAVLITRRLYRMAFALATTVIFQNSDDRDEMIRSGLVPPTARTGIVNGSGVDIERFTPAPLPQGAPVFLIISRLLREKGVVEFAEAARLVKVSYPYAQFWLVGPADHDHSDAIAEDEVHAWEREGILTWYGSTHDVRPFIEAATVYVLPSYHEGTPRTVLEAMAMGRPIITTDAPGCRQTVSDGDNGFLVPVQNALALAEAMQRFLRDPDLVATMGERSRTLAVDRYDARKVGRATAALLQVEPLVSATPLEDTVPVAP